MSVDLSLLFPEIAIVAVVTALALLEIFHSEFAQRFSTRLNLAAVLLVGMTLAGLLGRTGSAFDGVFAADPFALFFKFLFLGSAACVILMKREERSGERTGEFYPLFWSALLGMFFLVSAKDFFLFFISLELLTLSLYVLIAYTRSNPLSIEAALKYLILGSLASAFLLYGISLLYASAGTLSFESLRVGSVEKEKTSWLFLSGALLVVSALGFKVAAVPFHLWVPDVYEGASTPVVAFLSVASKSAGFAGLLRILFEALGIPDSERQALFSLLAAMTLFYGNLGALVQKDMKRLLGFSSIGHAGFLLIAVAADPSLVGKPLLYYLLAYGVSNLTAFLVVSIVENAGRIEGEARNPIEAYRGLSSRSPLLAAGMFLALLSLAGVPPLAGFFSKFFVLLAAARSGLLGIVFVGAVNAAIALYYYLNLIRLLYVEKAEEKSPIPLSPPSTALLLSLMAGMVGVGVWQAPFFRIVSSAAASLF